MHNNYKIIKTSRLWLRLLTDDDYENLLRNADDDNASRLLGIPIPDLETHRTRAIKGYGTYNKSMCIFQLLTPEDATIIGWCGYHTWYLDHYRAELGYALFDDGHKGKGLMSEALVPIIKYGFEQMNLNRIEAFVGPENTGSNKLLQKFHFVKEGQMRAHFFKTNQMEDSIVYSLLKREFEK